MRDGLRNQIWTSLSDGAGSDKWRWRRVLRSLYKEVRRWCSTCDDELWQPWWWHRPGRLNVIKIQRISFFVLFIVFSSSIFLKTNCFWLKPLSGNMSVSSRVSCRSIVYPPQAYDPLSGHPGHLFVFPEHIRGSANPTLALRLKKLLWRNFAKSSLPKNSFRRIGKLWFSESGTTVLTTRHYFVSCGQENLTCPKPSWCGRTMKNGESSLERMRLLRKF